MSRCFPAIRLLAVLAPLAWIAPASALAGPLQGTNTLTAPAIYDDVEPQHQLAGDFNGDGYDDYVTTIDSGYSPNSWTATVVFGSASLQNLEITRNPTSEQIESIGARGVQIRPVPNPDVRLFNNQLPTAVGVGDMDGDGYDDVAIGSPTHDQSSPHKAYIVYGGPGNAEISLGDATRVTTITVSGSGSDYRDDSRVTRIGDFDGDGLADLAVTRSRGTIAAASIFSGAAIVKGGPRVGSINANATSSRVSLLTGQRTCTFIPILLRNYCTAYPVTITAAGDFNGDGMADVLVDNGKDESTSILLGRTGTFSVGSGPVKLTGATYARGWTSKSPASVGDVNGDGLGDVGFRGPASAAGGGTISVLLGRTNPGTSVATTGAVSVRSTSRSLLGVSTAGDQNGDGRSELAVVTETLPDADPFRREVKLVSVGAASSIDVDGISPVPGLPSEGGERALSVTLLGGSDFDRDGKTDLLYADTFGPTLTLLTSGPDRAAPQLFPQSYGLGTTSPAPRPGVALLPVDFSIASGTARAIWPREAVTVEFKVLRADGTVLGTEARAVPAGKSTDQWNGTVNGTPLALGRYVLEVTPRDTAGNRGKTTSYAFGIVNAGDETGEPATILWRTTTIGPDGIVQVGSNGPNQMSLDITCPHDYTLDATGPDGYEVAALSGDRCSVTGRPAPEDSGQRVCDQRMSVTQNGTVISAPGSGSASFRVGKGVNLVEVHATCRDPAASGTIRPIGEPGWVTRGPATTGGNPGEVWLGHGPNETVSIVWNSPIDPREKTFQFKTYMTGGNGQAEGVTMAFLPSAQTTPATGFIGGGGALLGFGGLPGVALAIDMFKGPGDVRANQIGFAQGATPSGLTWLQTADPGLRLKERTVTFKLVSKAGTVSVYVNGTLKMTRAMTLPSSAYLAFTGSTGTIWQEQYISGLVVSDS